MSSSLGRAGRRDGDANWNQPGMKSFVSPRCFPSPEGSQGGKWSSQAAMPAKPQGSCFVVLKLHSLQGRHPPPKITPQHRSHHDRPPTAAFLQAPWLCWERAVANASGMRQSTAPGEAALSWPKRMKNLRTDSFLSAPCEAAKHGFYQHMRACKDNTSKETRSKYTFKSLKM